MNCRFALVRLLAVLVTGAAAAPSLAQSSLPARVSTQAQGGVTYAARADCERAGLISIYDCTIAFRNAKNEFDAKAPRYRSKAMCSKAHGECTAQLSAIGFSGLSNAATTYMPGFDGLRLITSVSGQRMVVPLTSAKGLKFEARSATELTERSGVQRAVIEERSSAPRRVSSYQGGGQNDPQASGPYVRRGDRDDTVRVPMRKVNPDKTNEAGLFVDENGVEWYRPGRRR
jgi:uncharacterized protein YgiB involved in biofilm formation